MQREAKAGPFIGFSIVVCKKLLPRLCVCCDVESLMIHERKRERGVCAQCFFLADYSSTTVVV